VKKRILSIVLAVALLVSLIPAAAVPVKAASTFVASDEMIELLKKFEGFSLYPYWDYSQWTVGYGTRAPDDKLAEYKANGIPEVEAQALLMEFLETMGESVNSFADKFGLNLTQNQFDALLSLTFNCGASWLYKPGTLRTAVIEGWTGDDFLFAFAQWSNSGDETIPGLIRRRLAEANLYLNGIYDLSVPANYGYVQFNANGGTSDIKVQGYDVNTAPAIRAVPTYDNFVFDGWYTDPTGGEKVTRLDAGVKGYMLYAHWRAGDGAGAPQDTTQQISGTAVNYEKQIATGVLNSFQQPVKGALVVDAYQNGEIVKIVSEYTDASGIKWGLVSNDGGWINLSYTQDFVETEEDEGPGVKITVTGSDVNIRRGPGTAYAVVGQANKGDTLEIIRTAVGGGYTWGKSSKGWIALKYTDYDTVVKGEQPEQKPAEKPQDKPVTDNKQETVIATGKVKLQSGMLNIRSGPSTGHSVAGYLGNGEAVEIYEIKEVGTTKWGRISKGWISLTYVTLDGTQTPETDKEEEKEETKPEQDSSGDASAVTGKVVVSSGRLNIRSGAGTNYSVVGWLSAGETVAITEQKTVNGTPWGKIAKGWVCMNYISVNGGTGSNTQGNAGSNDNSSTNSDAVKGTVSASGSMLRIRTGPGSSYSIAGYLEDGATVEILEQKTVGATVWGRISKGWISLNYVKLNNSAAAPEQDKESTSDSTTVTGTVIADVLNVRGDAGTNNRIVGRLYNGQQVTILETKMVGNVKWGRISTGWISMDYIK